LDLLARAADALGLPAVAATFRAHGSRPEEIPDEKLESDPPPHDPSAPRRRRAEGATLKELAESYDVGLATISRLMA
jgi:hypothetical protein